MTDWDMLALARNGDETAWRELYERYAPPLLRWISCMIGSAESAQDIVQDAFLRLYHARIAHQNGNFHAYLSKIVYRIALKERARNARIERLPDDAKDSFSGTPFDAVILREIDREIARIIHMLPEAQRDVMTLRFHADHSYEDIARIMGIPLGTVKSRIFHAVKECRRQLIQRGIAP
jgi:RNA polymerase sigma-70 factor, ECF subfamily